MPDEPPYRTATPLTPEPDPVQVALKLAAHGWRVLPLSTRSKRPLANCPDCRDQIGQPAHRIEACPCLPEGKWCHGVRAATTDPTRIAAWWRREPNAVPGVAAGPSGLVLIDIDAHGTDLPANLATGLLPGIDLEAESVPCSVWNDRSRFRDGRDTLTLLAHIRGGDHPWPGDPEHRPVTVATPSRGRHLWYVAPADNLHQVLSGPRGLAWQVDIKAGWSYGVAPGTVTTAGRYGILSGDVAAIGHIPDWLAHEVMRVATSRPASRLPTPGRRCLPSSSQAAYLTRVVDRGAAALATMTDGRQRALSALAYQVGGLLSDSGLTPGEVVGRLVEAGIASGLRDGLARRIVSRSLSRGMAEPLLVPRSAGHRRPAPQ